MDAKLLGWTLGEIAAKLGGQLCGPSDHRVLRPVPAGTSDPAGLTFAQSEEYLAKAETQTIGVILVHRGTRDSDRSTIQVDNPRQAFAVFLGLCVRPLPIVPGIHPTAIVSLQATVDKTASVGPYSVIERGALVGAQCRIYPFAYVGENCRLGEGTTIYPHAVLVQDVELGARCSVFPGAVLGADGFGFIWDGQRRVKIPQVGRVVLGDDVEVGANTAIDRATAGATAVGTGTKIDNLVQIAHNAVIGEQVVIASLCGISGSTNIGDRVIMGGQGATSDHVSIAADVVMGGRTGVTKNISQAGTYWGLPARPFAEAIRSAVLVTKLPDLAAKVKDLEARLSKLEKA